MRSGAPAVLHASSYIDAFSVGVSYTHLCLNFLLLDISNSTSGLISDVYDYSKKRFKYIYQFSEHKQKPPVIEFGFKAINILRPMVLALFLIL